MEELISMEPGYSDSPSPISEPPDITNWFSSFVYESLALGSSVKESEIELNGFSVEEEHKEKFVSDEDHKPMNKSVREVSDMSLYESLPSEPPDIGNWFSSYAYESPMPDTSVGLEFSVPGEIECVKETQEEEETTKLDGNYVCPSLFEQELVSSAKATDFSQSQSFLSEPPDVRNWFSSYEYRSPQLSDIQELGCSSLEKDQLIIDESDTEEENSSGIFRKPKTKRETTIAPGPGRLRLNECNENIAAVTAKEVSTDGAYSNQEMEKESSVRLFNASTKEVEQEPSFKQETLCCETKQEPSFSPGVSCYNPKPQSLAKHEACLQELRLKHTQDPTSSSRQKSSIKASQKACSEENTESVDQESDDKENAHGKSIETGFVTMKKVRFRESRDRSSMTKPYRGVLVECSKSRELKKIARGENKEEERKKKRRVLGEMSNLQFSGPEEAAGKWLCPQKNKGKSGPPLKQLRLDAWIHKI